MPHRLRHYSSGMLIRPVRAEDAASLRRNCFSAMSLEDIASLIEDSADAMERGEGVMLVAVDGEKEAVGTCSVSRLGHRLCRHRAEISGFVVAPLSRGTGLARQIVEAARRQAASWGCTILEISCRGRTHAEDAYRGFGFTEWGRLPGGFHDDSGLIFDEVRLWMPIPETAR
ncbi:MAG UNVERIFIED_CONTAM: GNAT family N-acetyltransferase [Thermobifida fusca]